MFEKLAKLIFPVAANAATAGATGGVSVGIQILIWVIKHLPEIILCIALVVVLSMYGCEKSKVKDLSATKAKLEETIKAKDAEIAKQAEEIAFQKDLVAKRTAELTITKTALDKQGAVEAATEEAKKQKDELLDKWSKESAPKRRNELAAEYWNTVLGIKATTDKKTEKIILLGPAKGIKLRK